MKSTLVEPRNYTRGTERNQDWEFKPVTGTTDHFKAGVLCLWT